MAAIQVYGMNSLEGEISVQGSKNGALPVMAGALLHKGVTVLLNVPDIEDTRCMTDILQRRSLKNTLHRKCTNSTSVKCQRVIPTEQQ